MLVPVRDFYKEVTGRDSATATINEAFKRWNIPIEPRGKGDGSRKYYQVNIQHLEEAKAKHKLEKVSGEVKAPKQPRPQYDDPNIKLEEVLHKLRGIEVALNALMKLAKS